MSYSEITKKTASELFDYLNSNILDEEGTIEITLCGLKVRIDDIDTIGNTLQTWLKYYLTKENIYYRVPDSTQIFPDFYLGEEDEENLLELKAFNYNKTPAFDVANFASYCDSLILKPYILFADYIVLGYTMTNGSLKIQKIWKKKVWEICSTSSKHKLRVQDKKGTIYNIRPCTWYSTRSNASSPFKNKEEFVQAIYETLKNYTRRHVDADKWLNDFLKSYENYYGEPFNI